MYKRLILALSFFFMVLISFSQQEIKVELKDAETNEPISFATIRFEGTSRGIIADYDGQFRLPYSVIDSLPNLLVTSLGYKSLNINPRKLNPDIINTIKMIPQVESLETVVLSASLKKKYRTKEIDEIVNAGKKMLADEIVRLAISRIPVNLNNNSHSYIGYYRDYQFTNNEYYNLNEGILEQFDSGILTHKVYDSTNKEVLYSFKKNNNFKISDDYAVQYDGLNKFVKNAKIRGFGGNELSILNTHNPIRNFNTNTFSYVYQLNKDFIYNHAFSKSDVYFVEDEPVIDIVFHTKRSQKNNVTIRINKQKSPAIKNRVVGKITIALTDFAIYRFDYKMFDYNHANPLFNVSIEYRKQNEKMYLNYISFNNRFSVAEDFIFETSDIIYNKKNQIFNVSFNSDLDIRIIKKRNFKIKYEGRRISIKSVEIVNPKNVEIKIKDYDGSLEELTKDDMGKLSFLIRDVRDSMGREIYKRRSINAYQFREFFVQEVFPNKTIDSNLKYLSKVSPLKKATINKVISNSEEYIINSPLKKRRMNIEK